jgi:hypothetical protein
VKPQNYDRPYQKQITACACTDASMKIAQAECKFADGISNCFRSKLFTTPFRYRQERGGCLYRSIKEGQFLRVNIKFSCKRHSWHDTVALDLSSDAIEEQREGS